jgi:hypothetical protein
VYTSSELSKNRKLVKEYTVWLRIDISSDIPFSYQLKKEPRQPTPDVADFKPIEIKGVHILRAAENLCLLRGQRPDEMRERLARKKETPATQKLEKRVSGNVETLVTI